MAHQRKEKSPYGLYSILEMYKKKEKNYFLRGGSNFTPISLSEGAHKKKCFCYWSDH